MIELEVSGDQFIRARKKAIDMGRIANSITNGGGNLAGFIGEIVVTDYIGAKEQNTYDYDIVDKIGNKIDVKTKRCNSEPKVNYDCSIAAHGTKQKCDMYVFVRVLNDFSKAWILGKIMKDEYFEKAKYHKKGELDPDNKFRFKADCYNVKIHQLDTVYGTE
tara:strand:+ start:83 stop:568 length:486 start_codon:yes stop_codon:yes gene_type:complete